MPLITLQELQRMSPLLRGRVGRAVGRCAMKLLFVDRLNVLYDRHCHLRGPDFAHSVLRDLEIEYEVFAETPMALLQLGGLRAGMPFITISNHPCGIIDGVVLIDYFGHLYPDYRLMANGLLGRVEALAPSFISVTPIGAERHAPTRDSILGMRHALTQLRSGGALGLFPAGAVSDFSLRDCLVRDREWQLPIIRFMAKAGVPILPVRFFDGNSWPYYLLGLIDWRVRLLRLPAEVLNKGQRPMRLSIGQLVGVEEQQQYLATHTIEEYGLWLRCKVYGMSIDK